MVGGRRILLLLLCLCGIRHGSAATNQNDVNALLSILSAWQSRPPSWRSSTDPCDTPWEGVICSGGRVTELKVSSMGIQGTLSSSIGDLSELLYLDLSSNKGLDGQLPATIGNLQQLTVLILLGCSFSGNIPVQLGTARKLTFLDVSSNQFTGAIPASLGLLTNLYWLDLGENQLSGPIPVSDVTTGAPGLDMLVNCGHFHFSQNQLSGTINPSLFSSQMKLIHILFDNNRFTGPVPSTIGLISTLSTLRLDNNQFSGPVPSSIANITSLQELSLTNNTLSGTLPNLGSLTNLNYLDLSQNSFTAQTAPAWITTLASLTTLRLDSLGLSGPVPNQLFTLPQLQQAILSNNKFSGNLVLGSNISSQLQSVNLQNNNIASVTLNTQYKNILILAGNPVCSGSASANIFYCSLQQRASTPYATSLSKCASSTCSSSGQSVDPLNCACTYPYKGSMVFVAPLVTDLSNASLFIQLESTLAAAAGLASGSVALSDVTWMPQNYLTLNVKFFPPSGMYFNRAAVSNIGFILGNQTFKPPSIFGPYYFIAAPYNFQDPNTGKTSSIGIGVIVGIVVGIIMLLVCVVVLALYARRQRIKAQAAAEHVSRNPFASWGVGPGKGGSVPHLSGLKFITCEELRKCTDNFSESHLIGSGGYGKVYKGVLLDGQVVAIKRAQAGSMQGGAEFKNEIELLSRVHHKNLVKLIGFCYEQGEQMLVYEYIPNGTLRENLIGRGGAHLSWKRRLLIAYDSARGITYLHELADPPIIHRDIKSTNILLDENFAAKVADFGLSKLVSDTEKGHVSTQVKGTLGYLDPEYYMTQQLSEKSDVFSFGVVMLELISAQLPIVQGRYIVREVSKAIDQQDEFYGLKGILDPAIQDSAKSVGFRRFVQLAMECVEESAANRPTMNEVVKDIEVILQNEGMGSSTISATEFGAVPGRRPYAGEHAPASSGSSGYGYSAGYASYFRVEPK